jgi:hypothetical protein
MILSKTYYGVPGESFIQDSGLAFVTILKVARNILVHKKIETIPADGYPHFKYNHSEGKILFDPLVPFVGTTGDRPNREELERVFVKWKI